MADGTHALTPGQVKELLDEEHLAVITTNGPDGFPHSTPVWYLSGPNGAVSFIVDAGSVKVRNIRRDPRISVLVASETPPYRWVLYRGTAELVAEGTDDATRRVSERYLGAEGAIEYLDSLGPHPPFVTIRIREPRVTTWEEGG